MESKKKLWIITFLAIALIPVVQAVDLQTGVIINTSISNSSITFNTYNVSVDELIIESTGVTMNNVSCSNGVNHTQVLHNVNNQNNDSSSFCIGVDTGEVFSYIDHARADKTIFIGTNNTYLNGTLNTDGEIFLYVNNTLWNQGTSPIFNISNFTLGTFDINVTFVGNATITGDSEVWTLTVETPPPILNASKISFISPRVENEVPYMKLNNRLVFSIWHVYYQF